MQNSVEAPASPFGAGRARKMAVVDDVPRPVKHLKGGLRSLDAALLRDVLNLIEVAVPEERRFEIVKRQVWDLFGAKERATSAMVTSLLVEEQGNGKPPDSDQRTG